MLSSYDLTVFSSVPFSKECDPTDLFSDSRNIYLALEHSAVEISSSCSSDVNVPELIGSSLILRVSLLSLQISESDSRRELQFKESSAPKAPLFKTGNTD
jgi:hypothetical protein